MNASHLNIKMNKRTGNIVGGASCTPPVATNWVQDLTNILSQYENDQKEQIWLDPISKSTKHTINLIDCAFIVNYRSYSKPCPKCCVYELLHLNEMCNLIVQRISCQMNCLPDLWNVREGDKQVLGRCLIIV